MGEAGKLIASILSETESHIPAGACLLLLASCGDKILAAEASCFELGNDINVDTLQICLQLITISLFGVRRSWYNRLGVSSFVYRAV